MSPLERRYRRMLRLLPAEHRIARGEELLGLLLDLDGTRDRPSARQTLGLLGLVLRLRLLPAGSMLLAAFLIADSTSSITTAYQTVTGAVQMTVADSSPVRHPAVVLLICTLLRLGTAAAGILGARRTALALYAASTVTQLQPSVLDGLRLQDLMILTVLAAAVRWHWPAPRPRAVLLAAMVATVPLWTLIALWNSHGISYDTGHPHLTPASAIGGALLGAFTAGALARRRHRTAVITFMIVGAAGGAALPATVPRLLYSSTDGWLLCVTALIALLGAAGSPSPGSHANLT